MKTSVALFGIHLRKGEVNISHFNRCDDLIIKYTNCHKSCRMYYVKNSIQTTPKAGYDIMVLLRYNNDLVAPLTLLNSFNQ